MEKLSVISTENYTEILKGEIKLRLENDCCCEACFFGILLLNASIKKDNSKISFELQFTSMSVFRKILTVINRLSLKRSDIKCIYSGKNNIKKIKLQIFDLKYREIDFLTIYSNEKLMTDILNKNCCFKNFAAFLFLNSGFISNPAKKYHIEINLKNRRILAQILKEKFKKFPGIDFKISNKKENTIIYIKNFDGIIKFLLLIKTASFINIMQENSVLKDIKNKVNRKVNCELKNMDRSVETGSRQVKIFTEAKKSPLFFEKLDKISQNVINIRLLHPSMSYAEIALELNLTKNQVSYYIKKINRKYLKFTYDMVESKE
ncbi:MAG: DNA-binding protein WhiA [Candidatus Muiribacteriota bacterium]